MMCGKFYKICQSIKKSEIKQNSLIFQMKLKDSKYMIMYKFNKNGMIFQKMTAIRNCYIVCKLLKKSFYKIMNMGNQEKLIKIIYEIQIFVEKKECNICTLFIPKFLNLIYNLILTSNALIACLKLCNFLLKSLNISIYYTL